MNLIQNLLNASFKTYFVNGLSITLTTRQKKTALVSAAGLSAFVLVLSLRRLYCFKQERNKDSVIDSLDSKKAKEYLAEPLIKDDGHNFLYLKEEDVEFGGFIPDNIYKEAVKNLTIVCVDTFLFNTVDKTYLLVIRKDPPAKGFWWLPGGRKKKGESPSDASERLCKREVGLSVKANKVLTAVETIFPDSMWDCQTDTVNFLVFATTDQQSKPSIDQTCEKYQWVSINVVPEDKDPYVRLAYDLALDIIKKQNLF